LIWRQSRPSCFRIFQITFQIAPDHVGQFVMGIEEVGDFLQQRIQPDALLQKLQIGKM
jgi:hypothetical protein